MKIAIFGRITKHTSLEILRDFFIFIHENKINCIVYAQYVKEIWESPTFQNYPFPIPNTFQSASDIADCSILYSIGGDGTLLDSVRLVGMSGIPILGINVGRLGFLTVASQNDLQAITLDLQYNLFKTEPRTMIVADTSPYNLFGEFNYGLNEITIHKSNSNEMIVIHTYVNGEFLNSYWADGLIIATPTGSTAYSLACGGPIISPRSNTFVLTPIAPHSLTVRPFILPDTSVISFEVESRSGQALVAVDNRTEIVRNHQEVAVRKADFQINLVRLDNKSYFNTLRKRLSWGFDTRN